MTLEEVYKRLDLAERDCLIRKADNWQEKVEFPSRIKRLLEKNDVLGAFDAFFCFDNKPLIMFYENPRDINALHRAIWNFNETPIVIVVEQSRVNIYNGFRLLQDQLQKHLELIGDDKHLDDFSYFKLVTGEIWQTYTKKLEKEYRVDYFLLDNIEHAQRRLLQLGVERVVANALIGKIIFLRYLIDRKVKVHFPSKNDILNNGKLCEILRDKHKTWCLFEHLQDKKRGFNGDLFPLQKKQIDSVCDAGYQVLIRLLESEEIVSGQRSLFDMYDFSVLPIEFISNVYERFIGKENQAENGAYYTPTFLVDYIVKNTVAEKLRSCDNEYNCKILDPSCGSGIFLVESLRRIIEKFMKVKKVKKTNATAFHDALRKITCENIFGCDKDESAVHVAIFSIYLTLLDYQEPADIELFKFPNLLGSNLIWANAFDMDNPALVALKDNAQKKPFDVIVGNPPWKRGAGKNDVFYERYILDKKTQDGKCCVGNGEIAQAFLLRSLDFAEKHTQCALVVTSKIWYNLQSRDFRQYFLREVIVKRVLELAPVRREVFANSNDKAIAPASIVFYNKACGCDTDKNIIEHIALKPSRFFSLFKIFILARRDIQHVQQNRFKEFDWLWKILLYGSWLDFNFVKRLKDEYPPVSEIVKKRGMFTGQGVTVGKAGKEDASDLIGHRFIDTRQDVQRYYISPSDSKWDKRLVHRRRNLKLFQAPALLATRGCGRDFRIASAIMHEDAVYAHSLSSIKGESADLPVLRAIEGLYNSDFFAYYNLMCFSSTAVEREQVHDIEKLSIPFCGNVLAKTVAEIETEACRKHSDPFAVTASDKLEKRINQQIQRAFACSDTELALLDYVKSVLIPHYVLSASTERCFVVQKDDPLLVGYANVFVKRFGRSLTTTNTRFTVLIRYTKQIIGMIFKVVPTSEFQKDILIEEVENSPLLSSIIKLSSEEISERLFVTKDIRGFDADCFYVFKPNERRLWHKAVAYVDAEEFSESIFRAERESANEK